MYHSYTYMKDKFIKLYIEFDIKFILSYPNTTLNSYTT